MLVASRLWAYSYIIEKQISSEDIAFQNFSMSLIATNMSLIAIFRVDVVLIIIPKVYNSIVKNYISPERYSFKDCSLRIWFLKSVPFGSYQFMKIFVFEIIQVLVIRLRKKQYTWNFGREFTNTLFPCPKSFKYVAQLVLELISFKLTLFLLELFA